MDLQRVVAVGVNRHDPTSKEIIFRGYEAVRAADFQSIKILPSDNKEDPIFIVYLNDEEFNYFKTKKGAEEFVNDVVCALQKYDIVAEIGRLRRARDALLALDTSAPDVAANSIDLVATDKTSDKSDDLGGEDDQSGEELAADQ